ncbi:hypothetical protein AB0B45_23490 [Nonomuraea sp. NPDC049152]|uniref:hypothetical protein n=1 Tax=Nonomuraea sp. NPDC049152 TaxID=3154350 RepID=UPI0033D71AB0
MSVGSTPLDGTRAAAPATEAPQAFADLEALALRVIARTLAARVIRQIRGSRKVPPVASITRPVSQRASWLGHDVGRPADAVERGDGRSRLLDL